MLTQAHPAYMAGGGLQLNNNILASLTENWRSTTAALPSSPTGISEVEARAVLLASTSRNTNAARGRDHTLEDNGTSANEDNPNE
jgi:hypothetical protein